ncbi:MAG: hypothetical protein GX902_07080 [Lentisphaerae bacterium]|nr:hypothetical protein [Lentisphaerota bacterium]
MILVLFVPGVGFSGGVFWGFLVKQLFSFASWADYDILGGCLQAVCTVVAADLAFYVVFAFAGKIYNREFCDVNFSGGEAESERVWG